MTLRSIFACAVGALLISSAPALAAADLVNVYTVGSNPAGNALDEFGAPAGGIPVITWNHTLFGNGSAILNILAEGVDPGENDEVFFNGVSIGFLTQQPVYSPEFRLRIGPGALPGVTSLTNSIFDVTALYVPGVNTVSVHVDPANWVNEIETSTLSVGVPEPATWAIMLLGFGLAGGVLRNRRRVRLA